MTTEIVNAFIHIYICILQDWTWRRDLSGRRGRDVRGKAVHFDNIIYIYIFICKLDWNRDLRKRCKRDQAVHFPTIKANLIFCLLYSQNDLLSKWSAKDPIFLPNTLIHKLLLLYILLSLTRCLSIFVFSSCFSLGFLLPLLQWYTTRTRIFLPEKPIKWVCLQWNRHKLQFPWSG